MKKIDKFILWIFSLIILVLTIGILVLGYKIYVLEQTVTLVPYGEQILKALEDRDVRIAVLCVLNLNILFSIKGLFFQGRNKKKVKDGILLENNNGKLFISMETLENLVRDVSKNVEGTESVTSKVTLNDSNELIINVEAVVYQNVLIKEVTKKMQEAIQASIKQASDLEVNEVNVNIKNISSKQEKVVKEKEKVEENKEKKEKLEKEEKKEKPETKKDKKSEKKEVKKEKGKVEKEEKPNGK